MLKQKIMVLLILFTGMGVFELMNLHAIDQETVYLADPRPSPVVSVELESGRLILKVGKNEEKFILPDATYKNQNNFRISFIDGRPVRVVTPGNPPMKVLSVKIEKGKEGKVILLTPRRKPMALPDGKYSNTNLLFSVKNGTFSTLLLKKREEAPKGDESR